MPRVSKLKLKPLDLGKESIGQRIAKFRKLKGYTQIQLADKIGLTQTLISDYERDKIRPHPEMIIRFALALEVSADQLLGLKEAKNGGHTPSLKILRRIKNIEELPASQQKVLFQIIDTFIKGAEK